MKKKILITGATDGIGLASAKDFALKGHDLLIHGRNPQKLKDLKAELTKLAQDNSIETYEADFSHLDEVKKLANDIKEKHQSLDILINNAGVFKTAQTHSQDGFDVRFVVNTFAPYLLSKELLALLSTESRIINLSSAAQASVDLQALAGLYSLDDMAAYAQSKLALTMLSFSQAEDFAKAGPSVIALNPGSLLATKMVKEGFNTAGSDMSKGSKIIVKAALSEEFNHASGQYFDNDSGRFATPHLDALNPQKRQDLRLKIEEIINL